MNATDMELDQVYQVQPGTAIHNNTNQVIYLIIRQDGVAMPRNQTLQPGGNYNVQWLVQPANPNETNLTVQRVALQNNS